MVQYFAPSLIDNLILPESESHHCVRVLRAQCGDIINVIDGVGHRYECVITEANPKATKVKIISVNDIEPSWKNHITIAVAPTKNIDRMEWLLEKLVEIGVNRFVPLKCRFSERKEIKIERLKKIAVSAMKQSLKASLPVIDEMMPFDKFIVSQQTLSNQKFICYCSDEIPRKLLSSEYIPNKDVTILIGPEGDFSTEEIKLALSDNFKPITLGNNRLRTETAAMVACDTCHIMNLL